MSNKEPIIYDCGGIKFEGIEFDPCLEKIEKEFGVNWIEKITYTVEGPFFYDVDVKPPKISYTMKPDGSVLVRGKYYDKSKKKVYKTLGFKDYFELCMDVRDLLNKADSFDMILDDCSHKVKIDYLYWHIETINGGYGVKDECIADIICDYLKSAGIDPYGCDFED